MTSTEGHTVQQKVFVISSSAAIRKSLHGQCILMNYYYNCQMTTDQHSDIDSPIMDKNTCKSQCITYYYNQLCLIAYLYLHVLHHCTCLTFQHHPIWNLYQLFKLLAKTEEFGFKIRIIWSHCGEF